MKLQRGEILLSSSTDVSTYKIVSPILDPREEDEWIINDGKQDINALVRDHDFLEAVRDGMVTFVHGSTIECQLQVTNWMSKEGVRTEYRIENVLRTTNPEREESAPEESDRDGSDQDGSDRDGSDQDGSDQDEYGSELALDEPPDQEAQQEESTP